MVEQPPAVCGCTTADRVRLLVETAGEQTATAVTKQIYVAGVQIRHWSASCVWSRSQTIPAFSCSTNRIRPRESATKFPIQ